MNVQNLNPHMRSEAFILKKQVFFGSMFTTRMWSQVAAIVRIDVGKVA